MIGLERDKEGSYVDTILIVKRLLHSLKIKIYLTWDIRGYIYIERVDDAAIATLMGHYCINKVSQVTPVTISGGWFDG